jgi:hypothetical protein
MDSAYKKVRLIQWALLAAIPLFAWVAEIGRGSGCRDWTWRLWLTMGLAVWSVSAAFRLRSRLMHRSTEKLKNNATDATAVKQWEVGQIISLAMAEGVAFWGLVVRIVFHGTLWQASLFYVMALFLLLLWTPHADHDCLNLTVSNALPTQLLLTKLSRSAPVPSTNAILRQRRSQCSPILRLCSIRPRHCRHR